MIEFVKFLRDAFMVILALFTTFLAGIVFGNKLVEKGADWVYADDEKGHSRVSYRNIYSRDRA